MKRVIFYLLLISCISIIIYYLTPDKEFPGSITIDKLVVLKSQRKLLAYSNGKPVKIYKISLGRSPFGHKKFEGDKRTPEGVYLINDKNSQSGYHKNLGISYPNEEDIKNARLLNKSPGGDIKIHGLRNGTGIIGKFHRWFDWTLGCIAVTNKEIDELYDHTPIGTPIEIKP